MNKPQIRKAMRLQRRSLTAQQQRQAARGLQRSLLQPGALLAARRIALYLVNDGEINPEQIIKQLIRMGKEVYLPSLHPLRRGELAFIRYQPGTRMSNNRFGIAEPDFRYGKRCQARFLSVICLPLVAFDLLGNRMGMGGGFYDRSLAFTQRAGKHPKLIGCAHEFQCLATLPAEAWDIPLSAIATDTALRWVPAS
ncbi:5-formyltetrahydrofolate cyclo-ligase [Oceanobacter sp. 5_MG-2023]|uniref:5-formyltetrahydrofolate cyclo-ligase n=1 Tax=Oceanobacter sp. 5_MG-2023 TaxID=3062645 RepID=UPI0026E26B03|nr:5-formyltetrahydrofolate cyclo-ligase [Oceanobacter sp. 5_MG-2023]MDO6680795.1 5-formyltetrahydrofolate cyclo-ligase [Oceanobacter sp. 5_MG-2023]